MTRITVKIDTVSSVTAVFYRQSDNWESLNQYEHDDMIFRRVSESTEVRRALNSSIDYLLSWKSE